MQSQFREVNYISSSKWIAINRSWTVWTIANRKCNQTSIEQISGETFFYIKKKAFYGLKISFIFLQYQENLHFAHSFIVSNVWKKKHFSSLFFSQKKHTIINVLAENQELLDGTLDVVMVLLISIKVSQRVLDYIFFWQR